MKNRYLIPGVPLTARRLRAIRADVARAIAVNGLWADRPNITTLELHQILALLRAKTTQARRG